MQVRVSVFLVGFCVVGESPVFAGETSCIIVLQEEILCPIY